MTLKQPWLKPLTAELPIRWRLRALALIGTLRALGRAQFGSVSMAPPAAPRAPNLTLPRSAAGAALPAPAAPPGVRADVGLQDWDELMDAVKARLRLTVGELCVGTPQGKQAEVRAGVLDCVSALDQLHTTLTHELARRQQLEQEVSASRAALAQVRATLIGTQAEELRARHQARHDDLTSLPNRSHFRECLNGALARTAPGNPSLAVLYIDLDGFKAINDVHGHDTGDALLRIVAARLRRAVRADDLVSRLGGDEFACLLTNPPDRERLGHLACKLFDAVSAPLTVGPLRLAVRPSIGIAVGPGDGATHDALVKSADTAMYHAKRHQTGYAFFE